MSFPKKNTLHEITSIAEQIQTLFDRSHLRSKAMELGFMKRQGKLDALDFLLINMLGLDAQGQQCSLTQLSVHASKLNISIGNQGLNERYNEDAVDLYKWLYEQVLCSKILECYAVEKLEAFNGIFVEDATLFQLPEQLREVFKGFGGDSSESAVKINCKVDLLSTQVNIRLKQGTDNDQNGYTFGCAPYSLWLRDLGYYKIDELINLDDQGAYFISRLASSSNAYLEKKGKGKIDLEDLSDRLASNEVYEQAIYIGNQQRFATRLVVIKLPQEQIKKRRAKLRKTRKAKGKKVTARALKLCAINVFVTNLSSDLWSAMDIWQLYRIRWQIEILFKAWKSILKLGEIKKVKTPRLLCQFYIHMIQVLLTTKLFRFYKVKIWRRGKKHLSELKGFGTIKIWWSNLIMAIVRSENQLIQILLSLEKALEKSAIKENKVQNYIRNNIFGIC